MFGRIHEGSKVLKDHNEESFDLLLVTNDTILRFVRLSARQEYKVARVRDTHSAGASAIYFKKKMRNISYF